MLPLAGYNSGEAVCAPLDIVRQRAVIPHRRHTRPRRSASDSLSRTVGEKIRHKQDKRFHVACVIPISKNKNDYSSPRERSAESRESRSSTIEDRSLSRFFRHFSNDKCLRRKFARLCIEVRDSRIVPNIKPIITSSGIVPNGERIKVARALTT